MFLYSILGGFLIGIGGIAYLTIGGPLGAFCFSIGLISILTFTCNLFTGKAGLLATKDINVKQLMSVWIGNFIGCLTASGFAWQIPTWPQISEKATTIINTRASNSFFTNFLLGILCGLLMYIAVTGFKKTGNYLFAIAPVAIFILCGFNHCVADMFYTCCAVITSWSDVAHLIPTTLGNIVGTNIIPLVYLSSSSQ